MTDLRTAAQQALETMEFADFDPHSSDAIYKAITALRAALAEPEPKHHQYPLQSDRMRIDPVTGNVGIGTPSAEPEYPLGQATTDVGVPVYVVKKTEPVWVCPDSAEHRYQKPGHCEDCGKTLVQVAEPAQEPVAWIHTDPDKRRVKFLEWRENEPGYRGDWIKTPLYAAPPRRKPLTEEAAWALVEQDSRMEEYGGTALELIRKVERAHGIGDNT